MTTGSGNLLVAGTSYAITVIPNTMANGTGTTVGSITGTLGAGASTTPLLGTPTAPTAVATGTTGAVTVGWTPAPITGSTIDSYTATAYLASNGNPTAKSCTTADSTAVTCPVTGLTDGTAYTFKVVANNANTNGTSVASAASSPATPGVAPGVPTSVTAVAVSAAGPVYSAMVSWTAPTSGSALAGYTVVTYSVDGTALGGGVTCTVVGLATTCNTAVVALTVNTAYYFTVVANGTNGLSSAAVRSANIIPTVAPTVPASVTAVAGDTKATVTWPASVTPLLVASYMVTAWTVTPVAATTHTCSTTGTLTCTVTGLTNGTAYNFKVVAIGNTGSGTASPAMTTGAPVSPAAAVVPGVPTAVLAVSGEGQLMVSWTAATVNPAAAVSFMATVAPGGATCSTALPTDTSCTINGLTVGTAYTVTVVSVGLNGSSAASVASAPATPLGPHSGSAVSNADGTLQVFARSTTDHLWTSIRSNAGTWGSPVDLGYPVISAPTIVRNANGQLDVFVLGFDHAVWHRMQTAPSSTTWSPWAHVGASVWTAAFVVETNQNGVLQIFGRDMAGNVRTASQDTAGGLTWTEGSSLGGLVFSDPTVVNIGGSLEVFAIGWNGALWHRLQSAPNSSTWSTWAPVGGVPAATNLA